MNNIKLLFITSLIILFTTGFVNIDSNNQTNSNTFEINQAIALNSDEDICSGSCVSAGSWQYCVVYSEMRWGQRNRTAQEAEDCEKEDDCTGTEICEA